MSKVAIAGGSGSVGRAIVEAILNRGKHQVIVLGRKVPDGFPAPAFAVDYSDIESLTSILNENKVDTVISALTLNAGPTPELNLLKASVAAKSTKRFIPSSWGIPYGEKEVTEFPMAAGKLKNFQELQKSGLQYSRVSNGYFLDYWGMPKVKSYLTPSTVVADLDSGIVGIPGSGDTPVVFTHTFDVGKFVDRYLDLEEWKPEVFARGDKVTWNEFVALAEEAKGSKLQVTYDSVDDLKQGKITELPAHTPFYQYFPKEKLQQVFAAFGLWFHNGTFDLKPTANDIDLNALFPDVETLSVKSILQQKFA